MGIIEMYHDVHQIRLNSDAALANSTASLAELRAQGLQLERLVQWVETKTSGNWLQKLVELSTEESKKMDRLIDLVLKLSTALTPEEEVVGIQVIPGPVTEHKSATPP